MVRDPNLLILVESSTLITGLLYNISVITGTLILPLISIFFVILRKIYLEHPYPRSLRFYALCVALKYIVLAILYCFMQTWYIMQLLLFPFAVIDSCIYLYNSYKLYHVLKCIRNGVLFHSSFYSPKSEYIEKKRIVTQFFYAQIISVIGIAIQLIGLAFCSISVPLNIMTYNSCFLSYISQGIIPNFEVSQHYRDISHILLNFCNIIIYSCGSIIEGIGILIQLAVFIAIIIKLIRRRQQLNHIEEWTRPLMEQYRDTPDAYNNLQGYSN